jgi:hypothetical protein
MLWLKNNKFLAGFFGCMIVGVGVLGYFLYDAYSGYADVSADYDKQATQLVTLQNSVPYPDGESLKKYIAQSDAYKKNVANLRATLQTWNRKLEPMNPQQFQEELKGAALDFTTRAAQGALKIPADFYMGFDEYQNAVPSPEAASPLDRQLKAAQAILDTLIDSRAIVLTGFTRVPLPEEEVEDASAAPATPPPTPPITYMAFDIKFNAGQPEVRRFLDSIVRNKQWFFIIRTISLANSKPRGPVHVPEPPEAAVALPDGPAGLGTSGPIQFILGKETVGVTVSIEVANFTEAAPKSP